MIQLYGVSISVTHINVEPVIQTGTSFSPSGARERTF